MHVLHKKTFKTKPVVLFKDVEVTSEGIKFDYAWDSEWTNKSITAITLYKGNDKIKDIQADSHAISGLLSDTEYLISAVYQNGEQTEGIKLTFKTHAKEKPQVELKLFSATQTSLTFELNETDAANVGNVSKIEFIKDGKAAEVNTDIRAFDNLLSNNTYTVRVTYEYDLNDGTGTKQITETLDMKTLAKATPSIALATKAVTQTSLQFSLSETDKDNIGEVTKLELVHGNSSTESELDARAFDNLLSDNAYTVRVTYEYDLNDGAGIQQSIEVLNVTTNAKAAPYVAVEILQTTLASLTFNYSIEDTDGLCEIKGADLLLDGEKISNITDLSIKEFAGLQVNNEYTVRVNYAFDLNDGNGIHTEAAQTYADIYQFTYVQSADTECTVTGVLPDVENLVIPETVYKNGTAYTVTRINYQSMMDNKDLLSVSLPATLRSLDGGTFRGCSYLSQVIFAENSVLNLIDGCAFLSCNITEITIPASVKTIGSGAFCDNKLAVIRFEEGSQLKTIAEEAFLGNGSLTEIVLPDTVESIGSRAFMHYSLREIIIPKSVRKMGEHIFDSGVTIYCEAETPSSLWMEGWDSGNTVYYKNSWHVDEDGTIQIDAVPVALKEDII